LFYMQQRGIPKKEAKALLMYAFSNDALKDVNIPELKAQLNKIIAHKLDVKIGFDL
jgi:Fe-S cluster assembly protein SufD